MKNDSYYVGYSGNLKQRIKHHNAGKVRSTKPFKPYRLVYYEAYLEEAVAIEREQELKNRRIAKEEIVNRIKTAPSSSG